MIHSFLCPLSPPSRLHSRSEEDDQTITKRETIVVSLLFTMHIYVSISFLFDGVHCCIVCCRAQCTFLRFFSITLMYTHTYTDAYIYMEYVFGENISQRSFLRIHSLALAFVFVECAGVFHINLFYYFDIIVMDTSWAQVNKTSGCWIWSEDSVTQLNTK